MIDFTEELKDRICYELMMGKSLTKICKAKDMPSYPTVVARLQKDEEFRKAYEFARNVQYEKMCDDILDIADDNSGDINEETGKVDWDNINRSRLKVDTRKWILSHVLPKKFGAKVTNEVTGPNGGPVNPPLSDEEKFDLARLIAFRLTEATRKAA